MNNFPCRLALEDGSIFVGQSFGAMGTSRGEVVFNTAMTGYQEILTDPSYHGQIVAMTMPHIGNYGIHPNDAESPREHVAGFVVKEWTEVPSSYRSHGNLHAYLQAAGIIGLTGVDTRALTCRLREHGALRGILTTEISDPRQLVQAAKNVDPILGSNYVAKVTPHAEHSDPVTTTASTWRVVAVDCGMKQNILRMLRAAGCQVRVVPAGTTAERILSTAPHGVLVGNGPGDPAAVSDTVQELAGLIGKVPLFGICLGHQLLALALGAKTYKLKFGHHGTNHPVLQLDGGRVEITSQNHGFAVDIPSLERSGGTPTHISLFDQSLEGFEHAEYQVLAVQYHPEAAPGPHDSAYLFERFVRLMD